MRKICPPSCLTKNSSPKTTFIDISFLLLDHYNNPRNVGSLPKNDMDVGTGLVGAPACKIPHILFPSHF